MAIDYITEFVTFLLHCQIIAVDQERNQSGNQSQIFSEHDYGEYRKPDKNSCAADIKKCSMEIPIMKKSVQIRRKLAEI